MGKGRYLGSVPRQLSDGDKEFIKLIEKGSKKAPAFREAYPDHNLVQKWHNSERGSPDHQRATELIIAAAKNKLQAKYMQNAIKTYKDKMEEYSEASLDTAIELVKGARSEKVRADLAIEGMRHKVGTPVQKVAVQEEKTVYLTFGKPPKEVIDGESITSDEISETPLLDSPQSTDPSQSQSPPTESDQTKH